MARFWQIGCGVFGILLIAAILFPLFTAVPINNSRRASCMSNMKQLGLALAQYSTDYNGYLPPASGPGESGWREAIYPYTKSVGLYHCPDDKRDISKDTPSRLPKSYDANALCFGSRRKPTAILSLSPTAILVTDTRGFGGEDWDMVSPAFLPSSGRELYTHHPSHYFYQHPLGTLNCLFADGHVKAMKPNATLTPINLWTPNAAPFTGPDFINAQAILKHAEEE